MAQQLECPICMDIFEDARCLSCSHTFCAGCIDSLADGGSTVRCPECRQETMIDVTGGAAALNPNSIVNRMAKTLKNKNSSVNDSVCDKHQPNLKKYFCLNCEELICSECTMENHQAHSNQVILAKTVVFQIIETMRQMFENCETALKFRQKIMKTLDRECQKGIAIFDLSTQNSLEKINDLFASLKFRKSNLNDQMQKVVNAQREQVAHYKDMTQLGKELLSNGTDEDIIVTFHQWFNTIAMIESSTDSQIALSDLCEVKGISNIAQKCLTHLQQLKSILEASYPIPDKNRTYPVLLIFLHHVHRECISEL
ncbi:tripartite motif-containing protein 2-like [Diadema setosum]|uniref:tripartite motif-containing protein 2-like n=1 Tax=Diadema setosum TaxID=31175 RepID=UPI003B3A0F56